MQHKYPILAVYGKVDMYLKMGNVNLNLDGYQNGPKLPHSQVGAPYDG